MGIRISEMEEATTFGADDYVPIVTNGTNKKALGQKIKDFIAGFFATKTGDNISDKATFRSAIEISATNTPFDKTGTGMSAENVQAGIVELSENRALINGSNIANPSVFRNNIGLPLDFVTKTATVSIASGYAYHDICGALSLSKGLWLVTYWAEFQENATGTRILVLSNSPNVNTDITNCSRLTANNNGTLYLTRFGNAVIFDGRLADYIIYLNASQDSGSSLSVRGSMRAIKLLS